MRDKTIIGICCLLACFTSIFTNTAIGQTKDIIFKNVKDVDPSRYSDIKGSCYIFKEFTKATLYNTFGLPHEDVKVNFNGEDKSMEALKNEKQYITVIPKEIPRIVIKDATIIDNKELHFLDSLVFVHGPQLKSQSSYHILLHKKENTMLFLDFYVAINKVTDSLPGEVIERKRFNRSYRLILINEKGEKTMKLNKKEINNALSPYGDFAKWCKQKKTKVTNIEAITTFLREKIGD